ncbi:MAG: hypothetical protein ACYTGN_04220 [Planctomycetota bacterium]|jgi:hypothetical protein
MRVFLFLSALALNATAQSPAQLYTELVKKFGKPSGGFAFTGTMWLNNRKVGTCRLTARPEALEGKKKDHWRVAFETKTGTTADARFMKQDAFLRRDFMAVRGKSRGATKGEVALWRLRGKQYTVLVGREMRPLEGRGYATSALDTTAVLFARRALTHRAKGLYVAQGIRADHEKSEFPRMEWTFKGVGEFCGKKATLVQCGIGDRKLTMAFSKSSRELYGYSVTTTDGTLWLLAKGVKPPK